MRIASLHCVLDTTRCSICALLVYSIKLYISLQNVPAFSFFRYNGIAPVWCCLMHFPCKSRRSTWSARTTYAHLGHVMFIKWQPNNTHTRSLSLSSKHRAQTRSKQKSFYALAPRGHFIFDAHHTRALFLAWCWTPNVKYVMPWLMHFKCLRVSPIIIIPKATARCIIEEQSAARLPRATFLQKLSQKRGFIYELYKGISYFYQIQMDIIVCVSVCWDCTTFTCIYNTLYIQELFRRF